MNKDFGPVFYLHLVLILLGLVSPILIDWRLILIGVILLQIQWVILGGCYLTHLEGKHHSTFHYHYLSKIFKNINERQVKIVSEIIAPLVILTIAIVLQTQYGHIPWLKL